MREGQNGTATGADQLKATPNPNQSAVSANDAAATNGALRRAVEIATSRNFFLRGAELFVCLRRAPLFPVGVN